MTPDRARSSSSLLVLGGTGWLGGAVAALATARGHRVTCLARGTSGPVPPGAAHVPADRARPGAYDAVADREWDAVLEVSWQPRPVREAVEALRGRARRWLYVSSGSVYADDSTPGQDESAALHDPWTGTGAADVESYGPAKVACERAVREGVGVDRAFVCRPGLIAGHGDPSDRFGYWPARLARAAADGDRVLTPTDRPVQVVDVRDLAAWLVDVVERRTVGTFDAVGDQVSFRDLVAACARAAGRQPSPVEADDEWLTAQGVEPWMGPESLPLWLPLPEYAGFMTRRNDAAKAAGLRLTPVADTVTDALRWERELGLDRSRRAGLTPARETELLDLLR